MATILPFIFLLLCQLVLVECRTILTSLSCKESQKLRYIYGKQDPVCCTTTICHPGQKFEFCTENDGFDTCQNCPKGRTHLDYLNTASFNSVLDPCIQEIDQCDASDQSIINGACVCDLTKGYFGLDRNKCDIDDGSCKKKGHELSQDGTCIPCGMDHFKPQDTYDLCTNKTRCAGNQEVNDSGSTTTDRTCRAKKENSLQSSPLPSTIQVSRLNNTREVKTDDSSPEDKNWLIWGVVGISVVLCIIGIGIWIRQMKKRTSNERPEGNGAQQNHYCCLCCPRWSHVDNSVKNHITGKNIQIGDGNNMNMSSETSNSGDSEAATPSDDCETIMTDSGQDPALDLDEDASTSLLGEQQYAAMNEHSEADTCSGPSSPFLGEQTIPKEISY